MLLRMFAVLTVEIVPYYWYNKARDTKNFVTPALH